MRNGICPDAGRIRLVVLIGADGFIGSVTATHLRQAGWNVLSAVYRRPPTAREVFLDVTDPESFTPLSKALESQDFCIVNASGLPDQSLPAKLMRAVHVRGMKNITAWAAGLNCRHIVQLSSIAVYGNAVVGTGRREAATRRIRWNPLLASLPYGRTKARAEAVLEKSGLNWTALRLPAVYGPGDSFFTPQLHTLLTGGGPLPEGTGRPVSIIPVQSVASLADAVLVHGALNASRNAVGAHRPWREILEAYAESWNIAPVFSGKPRLADYLNFSDPGGQMMAYYSRLGSDFPDDLLRKEIGWEPAEDWRMRIRAAAESYSEIAGDTPERISPASPAAADRA